MRVQSHNYNNIQGWMVTELKLSGGELLVFSAIYGFTQEENNWYMGTRQYLADWTGSTKQTVTKYLKNLVEKGLLIRRERYENNMTFADYRVNLQRVGEKFTQSGKNSPTLGENFAGGRKNIQPGVGENFIPINKNNNHNQIDNNIHAHKPDDTDSIFEDLWKIYPRKKGKGQVSKKAKKEITKIGYDHMARCIERYKVETKDTDEQFIMYGSTFFNSGYVDYLDENYTPTEKKPKKSNYKNSFNNFDQRTYDYKDLERQLREKTRKSMQGLS